eukprot:1549027-Prymnesium_polylepis.1
MKCGASQSGVSQKGSCAPPSEPTTTVSWPYSGREPYSGGPAGGASACARKWRYVRSTPCSGGTRVSARLGQ